MIKYALKFGLIVIFLVNMSLIAFASDFSEVSGTVLPETSIKKTLDCQRLMYEVQQDAFDAEKIFENKTTFRSNSLNLDVSINDIMGCGIKTGMMSLWMVPYYIRYILEFILGISGIIAVLGIIFGAYLYLVSGISDNKEKGKNAIIYSVAGFAITLTAWALVNIVLALISG